MVSFKNQLRFATGTETVSYKSTDSATAVSVEYALCGPLSRKQIQWLSTAGVEPAGLSIALDDANLDEAVPIVGGRIDLTDGTKWRILSVDYSRITGIHVCLCSKVIT